MASSACGVLVFIDDVKEDRSKQIKALYKWTMTQNMFFSFLNSIKTKKSIKKLAILSGFSISK